MGIIGFFKNRINKRELNILEKRAYEIDSLKDSISKLSNDELRNKTLEFKKRIKNGETLDDILNEAFAVVREASTRVLGLTPYIVQLMGAIVLHEGRIAEMKTGEGKTLVAAMPLYLNALEEKGAHLITVNDYLADYQSRLMGQLYEFLGLSVGCLVNGIRGEERIQQYRCDITYGTNNEYGFDYLRDNMAQYKEEVLQRTHHYAIVDEVDSILIDEARTPLIISGRSTKSSGLYKYTNNFVRNLSKDDVEIDEKEKTIVLKDDTGLIKAEKFFNIDNLSDPENLEIAHHINQAIRAKFLMKKDIDYVVKDREVLIVDEFTGRIMEGRRYSNGLHQAIEAKEGIEIQEENRTLATITLQNYFRMYKKLAGMTGTAKTEEDEFKDIYNMDVVIIPTNKPIRRVDSPDVIYGRAVYKDEAIVDEIIKRNGNKQPILVGTISVEYSEYLSKLLKRKGIKHEVLNALHHEREAEIISQAGRLNQVTIATNMAGRGTDIMLGGSLEFELKRKLKQENYDDIIIEKAINPFSYDDEEVRKCEKRIDEIKPSILSKIEEEAELVKQSGGLHVIGTSRHEARRIDNQLRGRSGRQGDEGSSQFFLSLEDDLLRIFMNESVTEFMNKIGMDDKVPIESKLISRNIERAQKKVESINYGIRKSVLDYDEVMNKQRGYIYTQRNDVLNNLDLKESILNMADDLIETTIDAYTQQGFEASDFDIDSIKIKLEEIFFVKLNIQIQDSFTKEELKEKVKEYYREIYSQREKEISEENFREFERIVLLQVVDNNWMNHIDDMDNLREGIGLRSYGQVDPKQAYQIEGFQMYEQMIEVIKEETIKIIFRADLEKERKRDQTALITNESKKITTIRKKEPKVGRNQPCPCGSGKKYKQCCLRKES